MNLIEIQGAHDSLKRKEAATILRVSIRTVDRLIVDGDLPASKVGASVRINRADVLSLLTPVETSPVASTGVSFIP